MRALIFLQAVLTWTTPSTFTNGTLMSSTDIAHYTVSYTGIIQGSEQFPAGTNTAMIAVPCGTATFTMTVTDTFGVTSAPSDSGSFTSTQCAAGVPSVPTGLTVSPATLPAGGGTITLKWTPTMTFTNGAPITEKVFYKLYEQGTSGLWFYGYISQPKTLTVTKSTCFALQDAVWDPKYESSGKTSFVCVTVQ